jgi:hypothetical protein
MTGAPSCCRWTSDIARAGFATDQPLAPIEDRRAGATAKCILGGIGLDWMVAIRAAHDEQGRGGVCRPTSVRLSAPATVEPSAEAAMEPSAETGVSKAETTKAGVEETSLDKASAAETWAEKAATEPAVKTAAKSYGNPDGPTPAPRRTPPPAPGITSPIPIIRVRIPVRIRSRHLRFRRKRYCLGE